MLTLTSADPQAQPEVRERMLSDPRDLQRLHEGVRALVELARGPEAATIVAGSGSVEASNKRLFAVLDDDATLDEHLLATAHGRDRLPRRLRRGHPPHLDPHRPGRVTARRRRTGLG